VLALRRCAWEWHISSLFSAAANCTARIWGNFFVEPENQTKRKIDAVNGLGMPEHLRDSLQIIYFLKGEAETEPNCFFLKLFLAFT
jgi:hypothetical protein